MVLYQKASRGKTMKLVYYMIETACWSGGATLGIISLGSTPSLHQMATDGGTLSAFNDHLAISRHRRYPQW